MITQLFALLHKFHTLSATNQWCPVTKWGIIYWAKRFSDRILLLHPTITSFSNIPHKLVFVNQTPLCLSRASSGETFSDPNHFIFRGPPSSTLLVFYPTTWNSIHTLFYHRHYGQDDGFCLRSLSHSWSQDFHCVDNVSLAFPHMTTDSPPYIIAAIIHMHESADVFARPGPN